MSHFNEFYQAQLSSEIIEIEQIRQGFAVKKKARIKNLVIALLVISVIATGYGYSQIDSFGFAIMIFMTLMIPGYLGIEWAVKRQIDKAGFKQLRERFKSSIVNKIIKEINPEFKYDPNGSVTVKELMESGLFDIRSNTTVEVDDKVTGFWKDREVLITNVKTVSMVRKDSQGTVRKNQSTQGYNGLMVRMKAIEVADEPVFLIPEGKRKGSFDSLSRMKLARDSSMTMSEQRAHNLEILTQGGTNQGYHWSKSMSKFGDQLNEEEVNGESKKPYKIYFTSEDEKQKILRNQKVQLLISENFKDQGSIDELKETKSLVLLDTQLMNNLVRTTLTYALHSGYIWVLIPAWGEKFELSLDESISERTAKFVYDDFRLALSSIDPFI